MTIIVMTLKAILLLLRISFLVMFWKTISLFPWRHWQVYKTWSKEMFPAVIGTSWIWSWKIGIDLLNLLIVNNFSSSKIVYEKPIIFTQDWELKSLCNKAHWTLGWQYRKVLNLAGTKFREFREIAQNLQMFVPSK